MVMRLAAALFAVLVAFPAFAQQPQRPQQQPSPQQHDRQEPRVVVGVADREEHGIEEDVNDF